LFIDTSSLIKKYIEENGSDELISLIMEANEVTISPAVSSTVNAGAKFFDLDASTEITETLRLVGINYFDLIYDDTVIVKTKKTVNLSTGGTKSIFIQTLPSFNKAFDIILKSNYSFDAILKKMKNDLLVVRCC
jgi:hypothetical protein